MSRRLVATKFLPSTIDLLDRTASRMGWSRAATLEVLVNVYADGLNGQTPIPASAIPAGNRLPGQKRGKRNPKNSNIGT